MKTFLLLVIASLLIVSCDNTKYPYYKMDSVKIIPDSNKVKAGEWVKETLRAASEHMTGGDYEDPEDVLNTADQSVLNYYGVTVPVVRIVQYEGQWNGPFYYDTSSMPLQVKQFYLQNIK